MKTVCSLDLCFIFLFDFSEVAQKNPPPPCSGLGPRQHDMAEEEQEEQAPHPV